MSFDQTQNTTVFSLETTTEVTIVPSVAAKPAASSRTKRHARHVYGVTELFRGRDELRGVYAPADLVEEFTRWCA